MESPSKCVQYYISYKKVKAYIAHRHHPYIESLPTLWYTTKWVQHYLLYTPSVYVPPYSLYGKTVCTQWPQLWSGVMWWAVTTNTHTHAHWLWQFMAVNTHTLAHWLWQFMAVNTHTHRWWPYTEWGGDTHTCILLWRAHLASSGRDTHTHTPGSTVAECLLSGVSWGGEVCKRNRGGGVRNLHCCCFQRQIVSCQWLHWEMKLWGSMRGRSYCKNIFMVCESHEINKNTKYVGHILQ